MLKYVEDMTARCLVDSHDNTVMDAEPSKALCLGGLAAIAGAMRRPYHRRPEPRRGPFNLSQAA